MNSSLIVSRIQYSIELLSRLLRDCDYLRGVQDVAAVLIAALTRGNKVLFFGNGGSAAEAQHLSAELSWRFLRDRRALAGITLTADTSTLTAIANDCSFDEVFSRQIEAIGSVGDVAFGITTSGKSKNVLNAMHTARDKGLVTVALCGSSTEALIGLVDHSISIPSREVPLIQEAQCLTGHILCELIEEEFLSETGD